MSENQYSMRFYKVLVYFGLFAGALLNAVRGLRYFTGYVYETPYIHASDVWGMYPYMQYFDRLYGLALIVVAFFAIYVRNELRYFEKDAIKHYLYLLISVMVTPMIYLALTLVFYYEDLGGITLYGWLEYLLEFALQVIAIFASKVYFDKRKSLFIN